MANEVREMEDKIKLGPNCVVSGMKNRKHGGEALFKILIALPFWKLVRSINPQI